MRRSPASTLFALACMTSAGCHDDPPPVVAPTQNTGPVVVYDLTIRGSAPDEDMAPRIAPHVERITDLAWACYEPRLAARPDLGGEHALRLWVSAHEVIRVTVEESTLGDPELELCLKDALLHYEIPPEAPSGGVRVHFRILFTPPS